MLIFYSQVSNPTKEDNKRFTRIKLKMGKIFNQIKKEKDKIGQEKIIIKADNNWIAVHQFLI